MATTVSASSVSRTSFRGGFRRPLQGFDLTAYIQTMNGQLVPFGEFTGFQQVIRNSTEPYLPLGFRSPIYLDGEFQIAFILEQAFLNVAVTKDILGFDYVGPQARLGRSPRFQLVIEYNAQDYQEAELANGAGSLIYNSKADIFQTSQSYNSSTTGSTGFRSVQGRRIYENCKIDAFTEMAQAGRPVVQCRIEGLAEAVRFEDTSGIQRLTIGSGTAGTGQTATIQDFAPRPTGSYFAT